MGRRSDRRGETDAQKYVNGTFIIGGHDASLWLMQVLIGLHHPLPSSHCFPVALRFENVVARHHRMAEGVRKAVAGWGLETLCKDPRWKSDSLTVIEVPKGIDSNLIVKNAYAKYDLSIGIGLAQVNGKVSGAGLWGGVLGWTSKVLKLENDAEAAWIYYCVSLQFCQTFVINPSMAPL